MFFRRTFIRFVALGAGALALARNWGGGAIAASPDTQHWSVFNGDFRLRPVDGRSTYSVQSLGPSLTFQLALDSLFGDIGEDFAFVVFLSAQSSSATVSNPSISVAKIDTRNTLRPQHDAPTEVSLRAYEDFFRYFPGSSQSDDQVLIHDFHDKIFVGYAYVPTYSNEYQERFAIVDYDDATVVSRKVTLYLGIVESSKIVTLYFAPQTDDIDSITVRIVPINYLIDEQIFYLNLLQ